MAGRRSELTGARAARRRARAPAAGAALLGPAVASYTAALIADTAVPAWHEGHREMPFVFVGSAASAAAGLGLLAAPPTENAPAVASRCSARLGELVPSIRLLERRLGIVAETIRTGRAGRRMRAAKALTLAGALGALDARRAAAALAAALQRRGAARRLGAERALASSPRGWRRRATRSTRSSPSGRG